MEITEPILQVIQRYVERRITRADAAATLRISERQVTRLCEELRLGREKSERARKEEETEKRRLAKERAVASVLDGSATIQQAALRAGVHVRTIARHVERHKAENTKKKARRSSAR